ncbi:ABC transporter ATP-binding protein [Streptomyces malaysiensis]|uniref:ABC transporter ATP-binding protein n=1 Tax=Streptomyces malaysiensis TaxID=92644 RepID=UPI002B31C2C6|nr:ABC transporter ATP-binding protein [Streptomyces malaysiensis]
MPLLEVDDLHVSFAGVHALQGASFAVDPGTVTALIGPNGAGKTTAFNCISRVVAPGSGSICFDGTDLLRKRPSELVRLGIARTFQHAALFESLDVLDNIRVGAEAGRAKGSASLVGDVLDLLGLADHARADVSSLPLGSRKRVELARALASRPSLLLLDEPAGGLTHQEVMEIRDVLLSIRRELGMAILIVEHHMAMIMSMSDHVVVLAGGRQISSGTPEEIRNDPEVIKVYLGAGDEQL